VVSGVEALAHVQALLVVQSGEVAPTENVKNVPEIVQAVRDVEVADPSRDRVATSPVSITFSVYPPEAR
jgi:hypothetical protein